MPYTPEYELEINVVIREVTNGYATNNRLEVRDVQKLGAMQFLEISGVLGKFHDLTQTIKKDKE
jgi:hypothetical protein